MNMLFMFVTELTSQLLMSTFNFFFHRSNSYMLVIPVVHDVAS